MRHAWQIVCAEPFANWPLSHVLQAPAPAAALARPAAQAVQRVPSPLSELYPGLHWHTRFLVVAQLAACCVDVVSQRRHGLQLAPFPEASLNLPLAHSTQAESSRSKPALHDTHASAPSFLQSGPVAAEPCLHVQLLSVQVARSSVQPALHATQSVPLLLVQSLPLAGVPFGHVPGGRMDDTTDDTLAAKAPSKRREHSPSAS